MGTSNGTATVVQTGTTDAHAIKARPVPVSLTKYPYPYRAMMTICSDLDRTANRAVYWEIARFLNTREPTSMGAGVGLEVGNSIFFLMPGDQFSYSGTDDAGRDMVRAMIRSGHIDCLHSYGDYARSRRDAEGALEELDKHGCRLSVWVDHSKSPTNFGPDIMVGTGDVSSSPAYHADLTLRHGIRYVWRGRTTSIIGQNRPIRLRGLGHLFSRRHPVVSARTVAKQAAKIWLGALGNTRWDMHRLNRVCRPTTLRDGQPVWEFMRSNPHWAGTGRGDRADDLGDVVTAAMLERLVRSEGVCVLYTHLGKVQDPRRLFGTSTQAALRRLAHMRQAGRILVTTTYRLLRYLTVRDGLRVGAWRSGGRVTVSIERVDDPVAGVFVPSPDDLMGLTFVVDRCEAIGVSSGNGQTLSCDVVHERDRTIASLPWRPLVFPNLDQPGPAG